MADKLSKLKQQPYRESLLTALLDNLRAHLIKAKFTEKVYGSDLNSSAAYVLEFLQTLPDVTGSELANLLRLNQSSISRIISKLVKEGYLSEQTKTKTTGGLRKSWELSEKGLSFLKLQSDFNNNQIKAQLAPLSDKEAKKLISYLSNMADCNQAPVIRIKNNNNYCLILTAMRRLTIAHGVIGENFMGSSYSALDWVLLSEVKENNLTLTTLAHKLSIPITNINQKLRSPKLRKLLVAQLASDDARQKYLVLSNAGQKALDNIEKSALAVLDCAVANITDETLKNLVDIFKRYVGLRVPYRARYIGQNYTIAVTKEAADFKLARQLLVQLVAGLTKKYPLSAYNFAEQHLVLKISGPNGLAGALELCPNTNKQCYEIVNFILAPQVVEIKFSDLQSVLADLLPSNFLINYKQLKSFYNLFQNK